MADAINERFRISIQGNLPLYERYCGRDDINYEDFRQDLNQSFNYRVFVKCYNYMVNRIPKSLVESIEFCIDGNLELIDCRINHKPENCLDTVELPLYESLFTPPIPSSTANSPQAGWGHHHGGSAGGRQAYRFRN